MAITIEQADAVSRPFFSSQFTQNVYRKSALLTLLMEYQRTRVGGTKARFPINYKELGTAQARGPREQVVFRSGETRTSVETGWSYYDATTFLWKDERVENDGDEQIINLMTDKADEVQEDLATKMARDLYTRNPNGKGLNDLVTIIGTGAFGGVDEPLFRGKVYDTATMLMYGENSLAQACDDSLFGTGSVSHIMLAPTTKSKIEAVWVDQTAQYQMVQNDRLVRLGLKTFRFRDIDFVSDQFMSESTELQQSLFGLDIGSYELYVSPAATKTGEWIDATPMGYPEALARVPLWTGQLSVRRRRSSFRFANVAEVKFKAAA